MDTELLVEDRIDDGRKLLAELLRDDFDVTVAFWAKTSEEGLWFLYVGSTTFAPERLGDAYRTAYDCLRRIADPCIALSEIKLVEATNPIARDAIAVRDRYPARIPTRYRETRLGNLSFDEAYIYPRNIGPLTVDDVLQRVAALMNRTGVLEPSVVTLRDGSAIQAVPVGIHMHSPGAVRIVLLDRATNTEQVVLADDVVNIQ
jgi:hypothetical protein